MVRDSWHSGDLDTVRMVFLNVVDKAVPIRAREGEVAVPLVELLADVASGADEVHDEERARQAAARRPVRSAPVAVRADVERQRGPRPADGHLEAVDDGAGRLAAAAGRGAQAAAPIWSGSNSAYGHWTAGGMGGGTGSPSAAEGERRAYDRQAGRRRRGSHDERAAVEASFFHGFHRYLLRGALGALDSQTSPKLTPVRSLLQER